MSVADPRANRYLPMSHASSHGNLHMTNGSSRSTVSSFGNDYPTYKLDRKDILEDCIRWILNHLLFGSGAASRWPTSRFSSSYPPAKFKKFKMKGQRFESQTGRYFYH